jgi:hypothetical protein
VTVDSELALSDQALEGLLDEFIALFNDVENFRSETKKAAIDPEFGVGDLAESGDKAVVVGIHRMEALTGPHRDEARSNLPAPKVLDVLVEVKVRKPVRVVCEKLGLTLKKPSHPQEALSKVGVKSCVHKTDTPVVQVAPEQFNLLAALGQNEVVGHAFTVVEEVLANQVSAVPKAKNEVLVSKVRVIAHQVPENRAETDVYKRLGDGVGVLSKSSPESSAE